MKRLMSLCLLTVSLPFLGAPGVPPCEVCALQLEGVLDGDASSVWLVNEGTSRTLPVSGALFLDASKSPSADQLPDVWLDLPSTAPDESLLLWQGRAEAGMVVDLWLDDRLLTVELTALPADHGAR